MSGPYVQFAGFCDRVLTEGDGTLSLIRVIDQVTLVAQPDAPDELPPGQITTTMVIMLKSGDALGRHNLHIRMQLPSGLYGPEQKLDVLFEGDHRGINVVVNMQLEAIEGLYWFEVYIDNRRLTRMPLRVTYQRAPRGA